MLSLSFGLTAALLWAVHDILARRLSQGTALLPLVAMVLGSGCIVLVPVACVWGDWSGLGLRAAAVTIGSGLAIALAIGCLYKAFSLAPVRLVSPIIGAYPLLTLIIAAVQGRAITPGDWLAVALVVIGIGIVATATREDAPEAYAARPAVAIGWSVLAAFGFAATFALGQEATRLWSELPVILVGRVVALAVIVGLILWHRGPLWPERGQIGTLALMGLFDAIALGLVTASGGLPKSEYASISSSLFGVLTVLLATWFLREIPRPLQWLGIATVFSGIAILGMLSL